MKPNIDTAEEHLPLFSNITKEASTPFFLRSPCNDDLLKQSLHLKDANAKLRVKLDAAGYESFGEWDLLKYTLISCICKIFK